MKKLLVIDNYDSFTYNLVAYCRELGVQVHVYYNDEISVDEVVDLKPDHILLSPGPGNTSDSGATMDIIDKFHSELPILGVCLGHQCLAEYFGAKVVKAPRLMHGKTSEITHTGDRLFSGIDTSFSVCRYHSLIVDNSSMLNSQNIITTAFSTYNNQSEIMALAHKKLPIFGVQFHPEAVLTSNGHQLLSNFLNI